MASVLVVATSHNTLGDSNLAGKPAGCWLEELASPYYAWRLKGVHVDVASIKGGEVLFDPASKEGDFLTSAASRFIEDKEAQALVKATKSIKDITDGELAKYDAIFIPGGHGIVWDGADEHLKRAVERMWAAGKVVAAVCHGPAGLLAACDPAGQPIVRGRRVTGFTNSEEKAVGKDTAVPYLLEDRLRELGGDFSSVADWGSFAVSDGQLITGQNPQSSELVAQLVVQALLPALGLPVHGKGEGEGLHHRPAGVSREHHHDHADDHPQQGVRHDAPNPLHQTSQWHQQVRHLPK